jgi:hypothetical protein
MNAQDLMFFEAEAVAVEAAKCKVQRAAEQHEREAKQAAKVLCQIASAKAKAEKVSCADDWRRRTAQARNYRTPDEHAQCGIRWYCRSPKDRDSGAYWHNCHACGQPLIYTSDPNAKPQVCKATTA